MSADTRDEYPILYRIEFGSDEKVTPLTASMLCAAWTEKP